MSVYALTPTDSLDDIVASAPIVVVDFFATWCGPCRAIAPKIEAMAQQCSSEVADGTPDIKFVKVDVDVHVGTATKHQVTAMPTFMIFESGKLFKTIVGANMPIISTTVTDLLAKLKQSAPAETAEPVAAAE